MKECIGSDNFRCGIIANFQEMGSISINIQFWWLGVLCFLLVWISSSQGFIKSCHWVSENWFFSVSWDSLFSIFYFIFGIQVWHTEMRIWEPEIHTNKKYKTLTNQVQILSKLGPIFYKFAILSLFLRIWDNSKYSHLLGGCFMFFSVQLNFTGVSFKVWVRLVKIDFWHLN